MVCPRKFDFACGCRIFHFWKQTDCISWPFRNHEHNSHPIYTPPLRHFGTHHFRYYESFPEFKDRMDTLGTRLLDAIGHLSDKIQRPSQASNFNDMMDDTERFNALVESVDIALERVDLHLDNYQDIKNDRPRPMMSPEGRSTASSSVSKKKTHTASRGKTFAMMKPQKRFRDKIDNSSTPWCPIIRHKPNAMQPLPDYDSKKVQQSIQSPSLSPALSAVLKAHVSGLGMSTERRTPNHFPHPYEFEINNMKYLPSQLKVVKEQLFTPLDAVPCTWVDTEELLRDVADALDKVTEFAVDLEHHSYRSFQGFTCLMQISTRSEDFLIDTLALRHCLHMLNSSFTNANIVKVLHGADMDIQWLQRDLGIYVVNLFDTGQAARQMEFPGFGLAYLLKHYCDVSVDKKYQLADWRVRPLSAEMLLYARQDTHYLLYIYDRMKNEAIETSQARQISMPIAMSISATEGAPVPKVKGRGKSRAKQSNNSRTEDASMDVPHVLARILERSCQISLKVFEKEITTATSHQWLCSKYGLMYTEAQMRVLQAMYAWRDRVARSEDESTAYVMPNHVMIAICSALPLDSQSLLACCRPVPQLVRANQIEIVKLLQQAKLTPKSPFFSSLSGAAASPGQGLKPVSPAMLELGQAASSSSSSGSFASSSSSSSQPLSAAKVFATPSPCLYSSANTSASTTTPSANHSMATKDAPNTSPVMSTQALYSAAGWLGPEGGPEGRSGIPLFDISALINADVTPHKKRRINPASTFSSASSSSGTSVGVLTSPMKRAPKLFMSYRDPAAQSASPPPASSSSASTKSVLVMEEDVTMLDVLADKHAQMNEDTTRSGPAGAPVVDAASEKKIQAIAHSSAVANREKAQAIHAALAKLVPTASSLLPPPSLPSSSSSSSSLSSSLSSSSPSSMETGESSIPEIIMSTSLSSSNGTLSGSASSASTDEEPSSSSPLASPSPTSSAISAIDATVSPTNDSEVPRSLRDIYRLANQNRIRNKEKKKRKAPSYTQQTPEAPFPTRESSKNDSSTSSDSSGEAESVHSGKGKGKGDGHGNGKKGGKDSVAFMHEIGWIDSDSASASSSSSAVSKSGKDESNTENAGDKTQSKRGKKKKKTQKKKKNTDDFLDINGSDAKKGEKAFQSFDYSKVTFSSLAGEKDSANGEDNSGDESAEGSQIFDPINKVLNCDMVLNKNGKMQKKKQKNKNKTKGRDKNSKMRVNKGQNVRPRSGNRSSVFNPDHQKKSQEYGFWRK